MRRGETTPHRTASHHMYRPLWCRLISCDTMCVVWYVDSSRLRPCVVGCGDVLSSVASSCAVCGAVAVTPCRLSSCHRTAQVVRVVSRHLVSCCAAVRCGGDARCCGVVVMVMRGGAVRYDMMSRLMPCVVWDGVGRDQTTYHTTPHHTASHRTALV